LPWRNFAFKEKRGNYAGFFTESVISMELEQRYVIKFLHDCGRHGAEIHSILMEQYGKDAYRKTAVYYWIKEVKQGRTDLRDKEAPGKPLDEDLAAVIQRQHEEDPYLSARRIGKTVSVALSRGCWSLHQYLGLNWRHVQWFPHLLADDQNIKRAQTAQAMLATLAQHQETDSQSLFAGDETWISDENHYDIVWLPSWEEPEEFQKPTHHQKKSMVTIFFNGVGQFHVLGKRQFRKKS
jgi:hypothetical protein